LNNKQTLTNAFGLEELEQRVLLSADGLSMGVVGLEDSLSAGSEVVEVVQDELLNTIEND